MFMVTQCTQKSLKGFNLVTLNLIQGLTVSLSPDRKSVNIVSNDHIDGRTDDFTRIDRMSDVVGKYFFGECLTHNTTFERG